MSNYQKQNCTTITVTILKAYISNKEAYCTTEKSI